MKLELSDLLEAGKADAPPPRYSVEDAVAAGRKLQNRRRATWTVAGAAAAVVAVAAGVAVPQLVAGRRPVTTPVAPAASPTTKKAIPPFEYPDAPFTGNIVGFKSGDFTVSGTVQVTPGYQVAVIVAPGHGTPTVDGAGKTHQSPNDVGTVTVFRPGAFDPKDFKSGRPVKINGHAGWYQSSVTTSQYGRPSPAVAWPYAANAWTVISTSDRGGLTQQQLTDLAAKLTSGPPQPARVGFKLSYVPKGFQLAAAGPSSTLMSPMTGESYGRLFKGNYPYKHMTGTIDEPNLTNSQLPMMAFTVYPKWYGKYSPPAGQPKNAPYCASQSLCYRSTDDGEYEFELNGGGAVPDAELIKMLNHLTFATDPADPSTWYDATKAVG
jgi:hypothetical protein